MDQFVGVGTWVFYVEGFFADAGKTATTAGHTCWCSGGRWRWSGAGEQTLVWDRRNAGQADAAVVMAKLDEDEVAGLDEFEGRIPVAGGDVSVAGEASDGAVDDVDFGGVEEVGDGGAPAPEAVGAEAMAVADSGVADEDQARKLGIGGAREAETFFLRLGVRWHGWTGGRGLLRG